MIDQRNRSISDHSFIEDCVAMAEELVAQHVYGVPFEVFEAGFADIIDQYAEGRVSEETMMVLSEGYSNALEFASRVVVAISAINDPMVREYLNV